MKSNVVQDTSPAPSVPPSPTSTPGWKPPRGGLAARMALWSAHHRRKAILGWLVVAAALFSISLLSPMQQIVVETAGPGEAGRADTIIYEEFPRPAGEEVLVQHSTLTIEDPAFQEAVQAVVDGVADLDAVAEVMSPLEEGNEGFISADHRSALVRLKISGPAEDAGDEIQPVVDRVAQLQDDHPDFYIGSFGESTEQAINDTFEDDLKRAGLYSVPVTLAILIVAFGALVAAGIPLVLALSAVMAAMGLVALESQALPMSQSVSAIILLIGLAVGVDYSMFYLKREREERAAGRSEEEALLAAAATSGRAVLVSGLTVLVAMAGMLLTGDPGFASFGIATMTVVAIAMLGSLTVLPALLSLLGDQVDRGRVPFVQRLRRPDGGRISGALIDRVLRRPKVFALLAAAVLIGLAVPAVQLRTAQPSIDTYPQSLLTTYNRIAEAFPGSQIGATVVVKSEDVESPEVASAIEDLTSEAIATGRMSEPIDIAVNEAGTVAAVSIPIAGDGHDSESKAALSALRDDVIPETVGALPDTEVAVTGMTAWAVDFNDQMRTVAPLVFGFVLLFAFTLMLMSFRSVVIALKSVVLNLLSVAAAYGILVLVFQHGWGKELLGFEFTGGIDPFLPILLFVILFGLSMDYHVLILSRIREAYDGGMTTDRAVEHGIKTTAGVVTSAALVMVAVFAIFATLQAMIFKQFGVGLAAAVLIDATIVRVVLLPASMKLLGDWNWYLPRWLGWLPHLEHGDSIAPVAEVNEESAPRAELGASS